MPLFSVVIPVYNRAELLREALGSVFAQEFTDYEVIVVDDGSTEDIAAVVREFGDRVKLLRQKNSGPGAARNLGIAHATGDYIAFLDSDDLWFPWTLTTYRSIIGKSDCPALIAGRLTYFVGDARRISSTREPESFECFEDYLTAGQRGCYLGAGQLVARRDALLSVGGFSDMRVNGEDHDLALRMGVLPGFVQVRTPATVAYRQHQNSETADTSKTLVGVGELLRRENEGRYAGGRGRRFEREYVLSNHIRPASLAALRVGAAGPAWSLYRSTLIWHVRQHRWKYLIGFPCAALVAKLKRTPRGR